MADERDPGVSGAVVGTAAPGPPVPTRGGVASVFVGPDGIRAGWAVLLFLAVAGITTILVVTILRALAPHLSSGLDPSSSVSVMTGEGVQTLVAIVATCVMALIERRRPWAYGLTDPRAGRRFLIGLAWGFLALSVLVGLLAVTHHIVFEGAALRRADIARYAALWGIAFLLVGLSEELLTRGYLQWTLARGIGFWPAALILSIVFGAGHIGNRGEALIGVVSAGTIGLVLCYSLWRSGSLLWAIGFHTGWDWAQSYFYGTPDSATLARGHLLMSHPVGPAWLSGGAVGPEGSILVFLVIAGVVLVIRLTLTGGPPPVQSTSRAIARAGG